MKIEIDLPEDVVTNLKTVAAIMKCTVSQIIHTQYKLAAFPTETIRIEAEMNSEVKS